jgi:hypothetical protein
MLPSLQHHCCPAPPHPLLTPPSTTTPCRPAGSGSSPAAGGALRRNAPTPVSTGLPARTILVAKRLTNSDVKGRILLPRAAVEANLSFAIGRAHSLTARDHMANEFTFTLQSWANGMESRRVYVLEHAGEFVRRHSLRPDDVIGISSTPVRGKGGGRGAHEGRGEGGGLYLSDACLTEVRAAVRTHASHMRAHTRTRTLAGGRVPG